MRTLTVAVAGFVIQTIGLLTFVAVASWNGIGKFLAVGIGILAMVTLLRIANSPYRFSRSVVQSALLALGFLLAHHTLALLFFPGLLKDVEIPSIEHFRIGGVTFAFLFTVYLAGSAALGWFEKSRPDDGERADAQSLGMTPPIIVNESNSIDQTGALDVFNTIPDLELYLEPWYADEPHFIFDSEGMQLVITSDGYRVRLAPKEPRSFNAEIARSYFASHLKDCRADVTDEFVRTATLSELAQASTKFATR